MGPNLGPLEAVKGLAIIFAMHPGYIRNFKDRRPRQEEREDINSAALARPYCPHGR